MKYIFQASQSLFGLAVVILLFCSFEQSNYAPRVRFQFPYKQEGLSERQAAAHLLSRFTFGATPGQVDQVVTIGLEKWFKTQLSGNLADDSLNQLLKGYDALQLSNTEIANIFPKPGEVLRMAIKEGVIQKDSQSFDPKSYKNELEAYMLQKGFKPEKELFRQFFNQKILRSAFSANQLHEILTEFWFNHFNVSITKNDCAQFIPAYERDVIRPHVTGLFGDLLLATAKSPAMLLYLDNFSSSGIDSNKKINLQKNRLASFRPGDSVTLTRKPARNMQGLNENYAREVMELHTLGVDGGYTQHDVTEAARVLTGWTLYPMGNNNYGNAIKKRLELLGEDKLLAAGFIHEGDFIFSPDRHDQGEKWILGKKFAANGGYQEGVDLLQMLANHPSTATFISRALATRFVSDNPPATLIQAMAKTFLRTKGDISQVLITMVSSREFWAKDAVRQKTKSPFELAISTVRGLRAEVNQPFQLYSWIAKMGQKMYYYQAPTGFPDKGQYWINTGALLNRMNFGLAFASQRIPGIKINLIALNNNHEPESSSAALFTYSRLILPERKLDETIKRLSPLLNSPQLDEKVDEAAGRLPEPKRGSSSMQDDLSVKEEIKASGSKDYEANMLSQVVGIIIGSPEFQRK